MAVTWTIDSKKEYAIHEPVDKAYPRGVVICATRTDGESVTQHRIKTVLPAEKPEVAIAAALQAAYERSAAKAAARETIVGNIADASIVIELEKLEVARG